MWQRASKSGGGGIEYNYYEKSSISVYSQSGRKWTYTFNPDHLYILEAAGASQAGKQNWIIQNGVRHVIASNSASGVTVDWDPSTSTVTITTTINYTVTLYDAEHV